ncbi:MAG: hypothetical protein DM484_21965, partial [Candidatus Methylumidiphilus alinenensis]
MGTSGSKGTPVLEALAFVLVPKLQLGNPALEAPASRIKGKPEHFGPSRSENRGRGNVTGCVTKQGQPFPSWSLGTSGTRRCAGSQAPAWEPSPRSSSFKDTGKAKALRTLTERESRARERDGMRYQAGTAVPKLELGNERNEEMCWFPSTSLGTQSSKLQLQRYRESQSTSDPHGARIEGAGTGRDALPSRDSRSQAGAWERAERGDVLVPKLQLG